MEKTRISFVSLVLGAALFCMPTGAEASTDADWPTWMGQTGIAQAHNDFHPTSRYEVAMEDAGRYEEMVGLLAMNIPSQYRPLHYQQLQEMASDDEPMSEMVADDDMLPDRIVQTGGDHQYWPTWIGRPDWF